MRKRFTFFIPLLALAACKKAPDNSATRYSHGLIVSVNNAKVSTEKANQAVAAEQRAADEAAQAAQ